MISRFLTGLDPLAYQGIKATQPPDLVIVKRAPKSSDIYYNLGTIWLTENLDIWLLADKKSRGNGQTATWINLYPTSTGGINSIQTDNGLATQNGSNQINMLGDGELFATRATSANSVSIELNESLAYYFLGNTGSAIADNNKLQIIGNTKTFSAPIVTIASGDTVNILQSGTTANTFTADDTNTAVPNSGNINIYGQTDLLNTSATDSTVTVNLTDSLINGQLLVGSGGGGVIWNSLKSSGNSISIQSINPNQIDLSLMNDPGGFGGHAYYGYFSGPNWSVSQGGGGFVSTCSFSMAASTLTAPTLVTSVFDGDVNFTLSRAQNPGGPVIGYYTVPATGLYYVIFQMTCTINRPNGFSPYGNVLMSVANNSNFTAAPKYYIQRTVLGISNQTQAYRVEGLCWFTAGDKISAGMFYGPKTQSVILFTGIGLSYLSIYFVTESPRL